MLDVLLQQELEHHVGGLQLQSILDDDPLSLLQESHYMKYIVLSLQPTKPFLLFFRDCADDKLSVDHDDESVTAKTSKVLRGHPNKQMLVRISKGEAPLCPNTSLCQL